MLSAVMTIDIVLIVTVYTGMLSVVTLNDILLTITLHSYAECRYTESRWGTCRGAPLKFVYFENILF